MNVCSCEKLPFSPVMLDNSTFSVLKFILLFDCHHHYFQTGTECMCPYSGIIINRVLTFFPAHYTTVLKYYLKLPVTHKSTDLKCKTAAVQSN